jgi:hypothetical protein
MYRENILMNVGAILPELLFELSILPELLFEVSILPELLLVWSVHLTGTSVCLKCPSYRNFCLFEVSIH